MQIPQQQLTGNYKSGVAAKENQKTEGLTQKKSFVYVGKMSLLKKS